MSEYIIGWAITGGIGFFFSFGIALVMLFETKRNIGWDSYADKESRKYLRWWTLAMGGFLIWPVVVVCAVGFVLGYLLYSLRLVPRGVMWLTEGARGGIKDWYRLAFSKEYQE